MLLGFVVFLILAPTIVLYVRGITYDFSKKAFVTTGILAMRLEPKDANIYLNNKLKRESSDIKFILPGEYDVTVKRWLLYLEQTPKCGIWPSGLGQPSL